MKERFAIAPKQRRKLLILLFSFIILFGYSCRIYGQGWTFTFSYARTGPCGNIPFPTLPSFPNLGIPTKSQCESMRQYIELSTKFTQPVYDDNHKFIGNCVIWLRCTPCVGSDISNSGQTNSGEVSFTGQFEGKPLFTPHQSQAFQDWAESYKQQLASYGITSILGKNITPHQKPLTTDKDFNNFYSNQSANFKPAVPHQDPNVVDLTGKKGVVQLLRGPEEQAIIENQYQNNLNNQGYTGLKKMDPTDPSLLETPGEKETSGLSNEKIAEVTVDAIGDLIGMAVTALVPKAELPSFIQGFSTNLAQATTVNIQSGLNAIKGVGSPNDVKDPGQLVNSSYIGTCTVCKWLLTPIKP